MLKGRQSERRTDGVRRSSRAPLHVDGFLGYNHLPPHGG